MGIGVAADAGEEPDVVHDGPLGVVEPEPLAEPERNQARALHVLHRLA
jgi:hypothetical protein